MSCPDSLLLTDLYQLTMLQAYLDHGMTGTAVFDLYARRLPECRGFLLAAGLESALEFLENARFSAEEVAWLEASGRFNRRFLDYVADFRFRGEVRALPEGTAFFPDEPLLQVVAPLPEAQLVETRLINLLQYPTMVASKAARSVLAAPGKLLVEFGLRRAHGADAGLAAARAAYLAGFAGSSNVLAEQRYGIPAFGTMAHSFILAHRDEARAFADFALSLPRNVTFLIDTFDTEAAARKVVELAPSLKAKGVGIRSVRLDSGDLADHARKVRRILDAGGLPEVGIFASGDLDEHALQELADAPIGGFGIGTRLATCADQPYLNCAYKLQEYAGQPKRKRSEGKATWPGRKQAYRRFAADGRMTGDTLTVEGDRQQGEPLLQRVMADGRRLAPSPPLEEIRAHAASQLAVLPEPLRRLEKGLEYPVTIAPALRRLAEEADALSTGSKP
jgi:nicotinate phosphoribosyltransferase